MNNKKTINELNSTELQQINGGYVPRSYYMDSDTIAQNSNNMCTFGGVIYGFLEGLVGLK